MNNVRNLDRTKPFEYSLWRTAKQLYYPVVLQKRKQSLVSINIYEVTSLTTNLTPNIVEE